MMRDQQSFGSSENRSVDRPAWSPAQFIAAAIGVVLVVIGGVALARTGIRFSTTPLTRAQVAGLHFTSLAALMQLVAGVLLLAGAIYPETARGTMSFFGTGLLAFGLIVAIDPMAFFNQWGYSGATGVFYAVSGAIIIGTAALSPMFRSRSRVVAHDECVSNLDTADSGRCQPVSY
jgi:hypothetical protein